MFKWFRKWKNRNKHDNEATCGIIRKTEVPVEADKICTANMDLSKIIVAEGDLSKLSEYSIHEAM